MKTLDTLIEDVYALFDPNFTHTPNEDNIDEFCNSMKDLLRSRLKGRSPERGTLRFSNLGKPDRQLWYAAHAESQEEMSSKTYLKFMYGDVIEALLLFLVKEAGHTVERQQEEIEVNGVKGHIDAIIDGVTVDVKSASPQSYTKFASGSLYENDPFGYIGQLSGYASVLTPDTGGAFLAMDKVHGDICLLNLGPSIVTGYNVEGRIEHLKEVIDSKVAPPRCFGDEPDGKSGNRKLVTQCSYCPFKMDCWKDANGGQGLRTFLYSGKPRFLTQVAREPDVREVTREVIDV